MTVDLENDLRSDRCLSMHKVVPKLLDFFDDKKIKATFFTVSCLLDKYESEIKEISKKHEIASHSVTHSWINSENADYEIGESMKKFKEFGFDVLGFRAPKFITTSNHFELLEKYGYKYDSSFSTFYPNKLKLINNQGIQSFSFPVLNSGLPYLKLLHPISKLLPRPKIFYLHPWEFLEKDDLPVGDIFAKKMLRHNAGKKAVRIFKEFIDKDESNWVGCWDYLKSNSK